jgi:glycolate oxidase FAD binding subunit
MERPATIEEAAEAIRAQAAAVRSLRPRGGGTKLGWGGRTAEEREAANGGNGAARPSVDLDTRGLNRIVEHNEGDFTAVLEAGVRLADAQAHFAAAGQMLALDPPLGAAAAATIGGVIATNDTGPLRHRYGSARDLVLGITVVLSDGAVAASGGKVIKNVAGYDLAKLFTGSYGTLGLIARVAVRLHPLPATTATVVAQSDYAEPLAAAAAALSREPLEADCLDVSWSEGVGRLLVRFGGVAASARAESAARLLAALDSVDVVLDDESLWARQRALQRAAGDRAGQRPTAAEDGNSTDGAHDGGIVLKVAAQATDLAAVLRAADAVGGAVVARAGLGLSWIGLSAPQDVARIRQLLAPRSCTVLDGAARIADPWPPVDPGVQAVLERVKARFDPLRAFRPGAFVGGI